MRHDRNGFFAATGLDPLSRDLGQVEAALRAVVRRVDRARAVRPAAPREAGDAPSGVRALVAGLHRKVGVACVHDNQLVASLFDKLAELVRLHHSRLSSHRHDGTTAQAPEGGDAVERRPLQRTEHVAGSREGQSDAVQHTDEGRAPEHSRACTSFHGGGVPYI